MNEESKIRSELREKHSFYWEIIRRNRLDTPHIHKDYCNSTNHSQCGAKWGHASIMLEIVCRLWWWFTGEQPVFVRIKTKPKLRSIMEHVLWQRKEDELEDDEYYWLLNIKDRCKQLLAESSTDKPKRSGKRPNRQT